MDANRDYWDGLIKDKYVDLQDEEMAAMGKGRRARREVCHQHPPPPPLPLSLPSAFLISIMRLLLVQINYNEAFKSARNSEAVNNSDVEALDEDDMTANPSGGRRTKRSGSMYQASAAAAAAVAAAAERDAARKAAARREGSSGPAAEAHVPLVEGEGEGLRVVGFSGRERLRFASVGLLPFPSLFSTFVHLVFPRVSPFDSHLSLPSSLHPGSHPVLLSCPFRLSPSKCTSHSLPLALCPAPLCLQPLNSLDSQYLPLHLVLPSQNGGALLRSAASHCPRPPQLLVPSLFSAAHCRTASRLPAYSPLILAFSSLPFNNGHETPSSHPSSRPLLTLS